MNYIIHRDQAVWEREFIRIEVPDDITDDDAIEEFIYARLEADDFTPDYVCDHEIVSEVFGMSTEIEFKKEED